MTSLRSARRPWSHSDVVLSTLAATQGVAGRVRVVAYFLGRRSPRVRRLTAQWVAAAPIRLRHLPAPLHVTDDTGGLATYYEIVCRRVYAPDETFAPRPGESVLDVGANIGVFSLWAAGRVGPQGRVVSVEPHPVAHAALRENVAGCPQVTPVQAACSDAAGELVLHFVPGRLSVSSALPRADRTGSVVVDVQPLAELARAAGLERVDVLKIDVEGLELEVLAGAGALLETVSRLVMEVERDKLDDVDALLAAHGLVRRRALVEQMWGLADGRVGHWERPAA
jgi:FkbM family methyltransferase